MAHRLHIDRRKFLAASVAALALPPAIARAVTIDAGVRTGTIKDVEHVVILMQENRSFDHYFGAMNGVRGFADRFPIPVADAPGLNRATCWTQRNGPARGGPPLIAPFPLNTTTTFSHMRVEGTPHGWADTQAAWDEGRMNRWPEHKTEHSMGYFEKEDIPFQYALANAFTLCDAYHCSAQLGTNTNRLYLWTGTNDPLGVAGGPSISNSHDTLPAKGGAKEPYRWTTYVERLQAARVTWRIYEDMADNFGDNPLVGFQSFRSSLAAEPGSDPRLAALGLSTRHLDGLREDVLAGKLPQVSYIVSPAKDSEHPGPSSPAQGADYIARVLDALTANPKVWARTVLFVNYDENDGFFDHVPPPAPPGRGADGALLGASTVDTAGEYHLVRNPTEASAERAELMGRPYGLGPRVPMYVISPWSRGGRVNSQVFDHTSVIRFLEQRFGVAEPNISPWRRAVCGDLVSAFNFKTPNDSVFMASLPETSSTAAKAAALLLHTKPPTPAAPKAPVQAAGVRPSCALPYDLRVDAAVSTAGVKLRFGNDGKAGAVFHVYDRHHLDLAPRRYTVEPGRQLEGLWAAGAYDLWVLGPNGFHRHFIGAGAADEPALAVTRDPSGAALIVAVKNSGAGGVGVMATSNAYSMAPWNERLAGGHSTTRKWPLKASGGWYDITLRTFVAPKDDGKAYLNGMPAIWSYRLAGRIETNKDSTSDPAMAGQAVMQQIA